MKARRNHEVWVTCPHCHKDFDARLYWLTCPNCGATIEPNTHITNKQL